MERMYRIFSFIMIAIFINPPIFASIAPSKLRSRFGLTIDGLYLRQSNEGLDYGYLSGTNDTHVLTLRPSYHGAFHLMAELGLPDPHTSARFNWLHFKQSYREYAAGNASYQVVPPYGPSEEDFANFDSGSGFINTRLDAYDVDVGQIHAIQDYLTIRLFSGARYAHLMNNFITTINKSTATSTTVAISQGINLSDFNGLGPLFGIASTYNIGGALSLVTNLDVALLIGHIKSNMNITNISADGSSIATAIPSNSPYRVTPNIDAKIGLNLSQQIKSSQVNLEVGYQINYYFNVIDRYNVSGPTSSNTALMISTINKVTNNFSLSGPYLSLNWNII